MSYKRKHTYREIRAAAVFIVACCIIFTLVIYVKNDKDDKALPTKVILNKVGHDSISESKEKKDEEKKAGKNKKSKERKTKEKTPNKSYKPLPSPLDSPVDLN